MSLKKTIAALALTGLAAFGFASASHATPTESSVKEGSGEAHVLLVEAIQRNGVKVVINHGRCKEGLMGFYSSGNRVLAICQDNGTPDGPMVEWTANDLDTLRHEAQHFIQDCAVGTNHDQALIPVYKSPSALAQSTLGPERVAIITERYRDNGASDLVLLLEYEAFSVAALNVPLDQTRDIKLYCGA